ncbi:DUF167 domain-containing protein [Desulfolithobacter sp.]
MPVKTLADGRLLLTVRVQPRASRNQLAGLHDGALKIRLTTPPVDGKANKALIAFLAKLFHLPKSAITVQSGHQARSKQLVIEGISEEDVRRIVRCAS